MPLRRREGVGAASLLAVAAGGLVAGALVGARQISGPQRPRPDYRFSPFEVGVAATSGLTFSMETTIAVCG